MMSEQENKDFILHYLQKNYREKNFFYNHVGLKIIAAYNGHAVQILDAAALTHSNLYGQIHGGVMMTIGDSCMGVACASLGKKVVTLDSTINFLSNLQLPAKISCEANVIHNGKKTILMQAVIKTDDGTVLSTMRSTYFVIGVFDEIKTKLDEIIMKEDKNGS